MQGVASKEVNQDHQKPPKQDIRGASVDVNVNSKENLLNDEDQMNDGDENSSLHSGKRQLTEPLLRTKRL